MGVATSPTAIPTAAVPALETNVRVAWVDRLIRPSGSATEPPPRTATRTIRDFEGGGATGGRADPPNPWDTVAAARLAAGRLRTRCTPADESCGNTHL